MIAKQKEIVVLKEMNKTFHIIMNDNLDSISKVHIIMSLMLINVILSLISYTKSVSYTHLDVYKRQVGFVLLYKEKIINLY